MAGKREKKKRRVPWLLLGLLLVAAIAGLTAYRAGFLRGETGETALRDQTTRYTFDTGAQQVCRGLDGGLAVGSSTGLQILDSDGYTVARSVVSISTPVLTASDRTAAVYDCGGTILRVGGLDGTVTTLDPADAIISAGMNDSGWMAVVTEQTGYKGMVTVYNAELQAVYRWYSGTNYVLSAKVSPDCKTMVALTLGEEGSALRVYPLSSEQEAAVFPMEGTVVFDFGFMGNDRLCAVHDDGLAFCTTSGADGGSYGFNGAYLTDYSLDGDGFATVLLSPYLSGTAGSVVTVGYGGNVTGQLSPAEAVQDVSVRENRILLRYPSSAALYSQSLEEQSRSGEIQGAKGGVLTGKNRGFLLFSGYCEPLAF